MRPALADARDATRPLPGCCMPLLLIRKQFLDSVLKHLGDQAAHTQTPNPLGALAGEQVSSVCLVSPDPAAAGYAESLGSASVRFNFWHGSPSFTQK